ncbi:hypothetical protein Tco_0113006, partial [Tanacetum coccineum]
MVSFLKSAKVLSKTNAEEEKCEKENPKQTEEVNAQGSKKVKPLEEKTSEKEDTDDEPPKKKLKVLIPTPTPLRSIFPEATTNPTPPSDKRKGKGIFSTAGKKMTLEEAEAQLNHLKRLANLKAAVEKSLKSLNKIMNLVNIQAQVAKMEKHE